MIPPEPGEDEEQQRGKDGFSMHRLEVGGDDDEDDEEPHFLGDSALLYRSDAAGTSASRRMMVFQGTAAGHPAVVLLDLGANANFVSQTWARRHGLQERQMKTATEVTTATGRTHAATTQVDGADVRVVAVDTAPRSSWCRLGRTTSSWARRGSRPLGRSSTGAVDVQRPLRVLPGRP